MTRTRIHNREKYYRNNESLKSWDSVEMVTESQVSHRTEEIIKCREDIVYFAEKYFTIVNQDQGEHVIKLFPKQKELLETLLSKKRLITLASRQSLKTTTYTIYALWYTLFNKDKKVLIVANRKETAVEILDRIRLAFETIPNWLKPGVVTWNKTKIQVGNGSEIACDSTSPNAARSKTCNVLLLDEFAFVDEGMAKEFWTSVYPVISRGKTSKLFIFSTPNGVGNLFHELYEKAKSNESTDGWKAFRVDWWDVPGRDEDWKKSTIKEIGYERFRQEFGNDFLATSTPSLISNEIIEKFRRRLSTYTDRHSKISLNIGNKEVGVKQYYLFSPGRTYIMSGDVADGVGLDHSVLQIWDITEWNYPRLVLSFSNNLISTAEFAVIINALGRMYNFPYFVIESNGLGRAVLDLLSTVYDYPYIIRYANKARHSKLGIFSHLQVKIKACKHLKDVLSAELMDFDILNEELIEEMPYFVRKSTSTHSIYSAIRGKHDDFVMTWLWMVFCLSDEILHSYFNVIEYEESIVGNQIPKYIKSTVDDTSLNIDINYDSLIPEEIYDLKRELILECNKVEVPETTNKTITKSSDILNPDVKEINLDSKYVKNEPILPEFKYEQLQTDINNNNNIRNLIEDVSTLEQKRTHGKSFAFMFTEDSIDFSNGVDEDIFK